VLAPLLEAPCFAPLHARRSSCSLLHQASTQAPQLAQQDLVPTNTASIQCRQHVSAAWRHPAPRSATSQAQHSAQGNKFLEDSCKLSCSELETQGLHARLGSQDPVPIHPDALVNLQYMELGGMSRQSGLLIPVHIHRCVHAHAQQGRAVDHILRFTRKVGHTARSVCAHMTASALVWRPGRMGRRRHAAATAWPPGAAHSSTITTHTAHATATPTTGSGLIGRLRWDTAGRQCMRKHTAPPRPHPSFTIHTCVPKSLVIHSQAPPSPSTHARGRPAPWASAPGERTKQERLGNKHFQASAPCATVIHPCASVHTQVL